MAVLPHIEKNTPGCEYRQPDASIIWLHGLGADGHDFLPLVEELQLGDSYCFRFIFPNAPEIPITINANYLMRAWYDILEAGQSRKVNEAHVFSSVASVKALVEREIQRGIKPQRIVLAGFSQGGAVALQAGLSGELSIAGILALSTYIPIPGSIKNANPETPMPVQFMHGNYDDVVPFELGKSSYELVKKAGYETDLKTFPMAHSLHPLQIKEISEWLQKLLPSH